MQQIWLEPWRKLEETERPLFDLELQKEISSDHVLFGITALSFGQSDASDDILFKLIHTEHEYASVHLTWRGQQEKNRTWPFTHLYATWDDFFNQRMQDDNFGY